MRTTLKTARRQPSKPFKGLAWVVFTGYSLFMIYLLFIGFSRSSRSDHRMYNVVPLKTIKGYIENYQYYNFDMWFINLFGNVAAFVPFGFLIPLLFPKVARWGQVLRLFFGLLFIVEALQVAFKVGSFDVDDIILNVLGGLIGFAIYKARFRLQLKP